MSALERPWRSVLTAALTATAVAGLFPLGRAGAQDAAAPAVVLEPGEIEHRRDLVGREVVVDDRVARFQYHRNTGFDQVFLKRAPNVPFDLPPRLRSAHSPTAPAVRMRGVLRAEGNIFWCEVTAMELMPSDLDRLNRAVASLSPSDVSTRTAWARWAESRARAFGDEALAKRAHEVDVEAVRAEADRPTGDPAEYWLMLAERSRGRRLPEPEPSALAHRGFRAALAAARLTGDLKALADRIASFFPGASTPTSPEASAEAARWDGPYRASPADAYRKAPAQVRAALDRRLWGDVAERLLVRRAAENPKGAVGLSDEAARTLPDRADPLATRLLEKGLSAATADVGALRQSEVESFARLYTDKLHQPERAGALRRSWLDDQKDRRLSPRDADGRIALAELYESMLNDRATAVALLRDAWKIDPQSREVGDAFRRRRFRRVNDEWVEPGQPSTPPQGLASDAGTPAAAGAGEPARSDSLRNATQNEVRARMGGKPNRKVRVASSGRVVEQWIYVGPRDNQYINFVRKPGDYEPRVSSYYSYPRTASDATATP